MTTGSLRSYEVIWEGRVREIYVVDAHTEDEARDLWVGTQPVQSEAFDGEIVEVRMEDD